MFSGSYVLVVWGAVFTLLLLIGCVMDLKSRRIPNELAATILATGWLFALTSPNPGRALTLSVAGTAVGFGIWIAFYLVGAIGAGDVKFFAAAGAWLGPSGAWRAALIAAVVGGVLAVAFLVIEKRLGEVLRRMALAVSSGSVAGIQERSATSGPRPRSIPYGVALAIGALAAAWVPQLS